MVLPRYAMPLMRNVLPSLLFFALLAALGVRTTQAQQTVVETDKGDVYSGRILTEDNKWITIQMEDSSEVRLNKEHITQMKFGAAARNYTGAQRSIDGEDEEVRGPRGNRIKAKMENYSTLGFLFLTPGGFNISYGYYLRSLGTRVTVGMIPGGGFGVQGNITANISRSETFSSEVGGAIGALSIGGYDMTYVGPVYNLNSGGFFFEGGIAFGAGSFPNPQFLIQLGYMYQFR